ncbi:MAG: hypothetical protein J6D00_05350 [Christensenellaceae bacterium]|nr:hypothetical protein [Christensenellaceae bacterium]MBR3841678.1 hypothetical protein [Christensenellaceae bacterium]
MIPVKRSQAGVSAGHEFSFPSIVNLGGTTAKTVPYFGTVFLLQNSGKTGHKAR